MTQPNPYSPPSTVVDDARQPLGADTLITDGQRRPLHHGLKWISDSWELYKRQPGMWILSLLVFYAVLIVVSLVPFLNLALVVIGPIFGAGFIAMAHASHRGERFTVGDLFAGFRRQTGPLLLVGLCYFAMFMVVIAALMVYAGPVFLALAAGNADPAEVMSVGVLAIGIYVLAMMAIAVAIAFAPALVYLHNVAPLAALRMSFMGGIKNALPGLVGGIVFLVLFMLSIIPLGLGMLITVPMMIIMVYAIYRDIFLLPSG